MMYAQSSSDQVDLDSNNGSDSELSATKQNHQASILAELSPHQTATHKVWTQKPGITTVALAALGSDVRDNVSDWRLPRT
jgi:hypothetical protein